MANKNTWITRLSYNGVKSEHLDADRFLLVVASRTVGRYLISEARPLLCKDYQDILAPSENLLKDYKAGRADAIAYTKRYRREAKRNGVYEALESLRRLSVERGVQIVLLCHCGEGAFCHTNLLIQWLRDKQQRDAYAMMDASILDAPRKDTRKGLWKYVSNTRQGKGIVTSTISPGSQGGMPLGKGK